MPVQLEDDGPHKGDHLQYQVHITSPPAGSRIERPESLPPADHFAAQKAAQLPLTIPFILPALALERRARRARYHASRPKGKRIGLLLGGTHPRPLRFGSGVKGLGASESFRLASAGAPCKANLASSDMLAIFRAARFKGFVSADIRLVTIRKLVKIEQPVVPGCRAHAIISPSAGERQIRFALRLSF
jgi:hypothetical protein